MELGQQSRRLDHSENSIEGIEFALRPVGGTDREGK